MKKLQSAILLTMSIMAVPIYAQTRMAEPNQSSTLGAGSNTAISTNPNGEITPKPMGDYNSSANSSTSTTAAMEQTLNQEQMHKDWMNKQWDKDQWNAMSSTEKKEYKERHKVMWNNMTPDERARWNKDHQGQTNHMNKKWYQGDMNK